MKCFFMIIITLVISHPILCMEREEHNAPRNVTLFPAPSQQANKPFDKKELECHICLDKIAKGSFYSCLPCQHVMHYECYKSFAATPVGKKCALCRTPIAQEESNKLKSAPSGIIEHAADPEILPSHARLNNNTLKDNIKRLQEALEESQKNVALALKEFEHFKLLHGELTQVHELKKCIEETTKKLTIAQQKKQDIQRSLQRVRGVNDDLNEHIQALRIANDTQAQKLQNSKQLLRDYLHDDYFIKSWILYGSSSLVSIAAITTACTYCKKTSSKLKGVAGALALGVSIAALGTQYLNSYYSKEKTKIKNI